MPVPESAQTGWITSAPGESPAYVEAWKNVLALGDGLDDARLIAEFGSLSGITSDQIPVGQSAAVEAYADVRPRGQIETVKVRVQEPTHEHIQSRFAELQGVSVDESEIEIVALRVRRYRRSG